MTFFAKRLPKLAGLVGLVLVAACSTERLSSPAPTVTDPAMNVLAAELPAVVLRSAVAAAEVATPTTTGGRFHTMAVVYPSNAVAFQFTVNPTVSSTFIIGTHMVSFPANTICNPSSSTYGAGTWLTSCTKATSSITITATTWVDVVGRTQIDFANALRFYPNSAGQLPAIYLRDAWAAMSSFGRVDYCSTSTSCVDESIADTTLATQRDPVTGYLFRLIRHFSGYNVWA